MPNAKSILNKNKRPWHNTHLHTCLTSCVAYKCEQVMHNKLLI